MTIESAIGCGFKYWFCDAEKLLSASVSFANNLTVFWGLNESVAKENTNIISYIHQLIETCYFHFHGILKWVGMGSD